MANLIHKCRGEVLRWLPIDDEVYVKGSATPASLRFKNLL